MQKLPELIHDIEDQGTRISIEDGGKPLGEALVVQVEGTERDYEQCSRSIANQLRGEADEPELDFEDL